MQFHINVEPTREGIWRVRAEGKILGTIEHFPDNPKRAWKAKPIGGRPTFHVKIKSAARSIVTAKSIVSVIGT